MDCEYTTLGGKLKISFEAKTTKEIVQTLAGIQAVCEQEKCTNCENKTFTYVYRLVDGDPYYELKCKKCHWKLGFSIPKKGDGNLYPRWKNQNTGQTIGPKGDGWHFYESTKDDNDEDPKTAKNQKNNK